MFTMAEEIKVGDLFSETGNSPTLKVSAFSMDKKKVYFEKIQSAYCKKKKFAVFPIEHVIQFYTHIKVD